MSTSKQWQLAHEAAERYERILVRSILGPFAQALVDWSSLQPGEIVVDIGTGTGTAARFAAEQLGASGRVLGVDVNPGMLDVARSIPAEGTATIEWHENSALDLPMDDGTVDIAICTQTLQFIDDRHSTLKEMHRVIKPGGRATLSLWSPIEESPYFHALVEAMARHIGKDTAAGLGAAFGLTDADAIQSLLDRAGFKDIELTTIQLDLDLPSAEVFVPEHVSATPMSGGYNAASPEAQMMVVKDLDTALVSYRYNGGLRVPFKSFVARGFKDSH